QPRDITSPLAFMLILSLMSSLCTTTTCTSEQRMCAISDWLSISAWWAVYIPYAAAGSPRIFYSRMPIHSILTISYTSHFPSGMNLTIRLSTQIKPLLTTWHNGPVYGLLNSLPSSDDALNL